MLKMEHPTCSCGQSFRTLRDLDEHIRGEGGSQSHSLWYYVNGHTGAWVDVPSPAASASEPREACNV